jgi:hypothetical protein
MPKLRYIVLYALLVSPLAAADRRSPTPGNDVVHFQNGDALTGTVLRGTPSTVEFTNLAVGNLTLKWRDLQSIQLGHAMAIANGPTAMNTRVFNSPTLAVAPGTSLTKLNLEVREPGSASPLVIQDVQSIAGADKCASGIQTACPGWQLEKVKFSAANLAATQQQQTYSAEVDVRRNWNPEEDGWPHQRTSLQLIPSYDEKRKNNKPGSANITQDYGAKLQHLFYINSDNFYASTVADIYRNNSLGLYFEQSYGAGLGTIVCDWEIGADLRFIGQHFYAPTHGTQLVGSQLSERRSFGLDFLRPGASLSELGIFIPVFNASRSWQTQGRLDLSIPITQKLSFIAGLFDTYVENAPPSFRKNYLKSTVGLQFSPSGKH